MTSPGPITIGTTWTLLIDLNGKLTKRLTISRESEQTLELIYSANNTTPSESDSPEWRLTTSFLAIETSKIPTGGQIWARFETESADVEVNYV